MTRWLAALAAAAGFLRAGDAAADVFYLTSPYQTVLPPPPLNAGRTALQTPTETETPGHVTSRERIGVGVGPGGTPVRVTVTQRLRVHGTGDYSFTIPAPATSVVRGADSESLPGLRDAGIVWQGFSTRDRVLSATATLRPRAAAPGLPLQIALEPRGRVTRVRLENVAHRRLPVLTGRASRARLDIVLATLRARLPASQVPSGLLSVSGEFGRTVQREVAAPLRVTGTIGSTPVDELLGRGRPLTRTLIARGRPVVRLRVDLLAPVAILPSRRELARAPQPVEALQTALGAVAISRAYARFLGSPDPVGVSDATYVYRSARPAASAAPAARRVAHEESDALTVALVALLGAGGLAGLAAVWARS